MSSIDTVSFGLALSAGALSFLSPCVFPLVPSYLTFITGMTLDDLAAEHHTTRAHAIRMRVMGDASLFVLGFSFVFVTLGITATTFGRFVTHSLPALQLVGGVMVAVFGLHLTGFVRLPGLYRERRVQLMRRPAGRLGAIVVGLAFGAGWTPCVGPVLASILLYASMTASMGQGMLLLATYAIGLGIPFLVSAYAFETFLARSRFLRRWLRPLEMATGVVLVGVGVFLASGRFRLLTATLAGLGQLFPLGS